jgi:hypothetical protein
MGMRRIAVLVVALTAVMLLGATAAFAGPGAAPVTQGSGAGQTKLSAALGFNMDINENGQFNYVADPNGPNAGFHGHCSGYSRVFKWTSWDGFPSLRFRSDTCTDQDGNAVYLRGKIIDRGEPGVPNGDYAHVIWCYTLGQSGECMLDDNYISDNGKITAGNIQINHF